MSLSSAMNVGVSGLGINAEAISVVGNNIANVNTVGFKEGRTIFSDMLSANIGAGQVGRGGQIQTIQNMFSQGSFENTGGENDLAIQGESFFVLQDSMGTQSFTRAGAFDYNKNQILVNPNGMEVMGYGITQATGQSNGILGTIDKTAFATLAPKTTTEASFVMNLDSTVNAPNSSVTSSVRVDGDFGQVEPSTTTAVNLTGGGAAGGSVTIVAADGTNYAGVIGTMTVPAATDAPLTIAVNGQTTTIGTYTTLAGNITALTFDGTPVAVAAGVTQPITFTNAAAMIGAVPTATAGTSTPVPTTTDVEITDAGLVGGGVNIITAAGATVVGQITDATGAALAASAPAGTPLCITIAGVSTPIGTYSSDAGSNITNITYSNPVSVDIGAGVTQPITFTSGAVFDAAITAGTAAFANTASGTIASAGNPANTTISFYDEFGNTQTADITWAGSDPNYTYSIAIPNATAGTPGSTGFEIAGTLNFPTPTTSTVNTTVTLNNGAKPMPMTFDLSNMTNSTSATTPTASTNGAPIKTANIVLTGGTTAGGTGTLVDSSGVSHDVTISFPTATTWQADIVGATPATATITGSFASAVNGKSIWDQSSGTVNIGGVTQPITFDLSNVTTGAAVTDVRSNGWDQTNPAVTANFSNSTQLYDSQGNAHTATVYYSKTGANAWDYHLSIPDATSINGMAGNKLLNGSLTFNTAGILISQVPSNVNGFAVQFPGSVASQTVTLDFNPNASTQLASSSVLSFQNQNGYGAGNLISTKIDDKGYVNASYTNNQTQRIGLVALARFASVAGLEKAGNSLFNSTEKSGFAIIGTAELQGGKIFTKSLEQSNVDMATQLVNMIKLQRAYSGNSKTITSSDEMMQETLGLKR